MALCILYIGGGSSRQRGNQGKGAGRGGNGEELKVMGRGHDGSLGKEGKESWSFQKYTCRKSIVPCPIKNLVPGLSEFSILKRMLQCCWLPFVSTWFGWAMTYQLGSGFELMPPGCF